MKQILVWTLIIFLLSCSNTRKLNPKQYKQKTHHYRYNKHYHQNKMKVNVMQKRSSYGK